MKQHLPNIKRKSSRVCCSLKHVLTFKLKKYMSIRFATISFLMRVPTCLFSAMEWHVTFPHIHLLVLAVSRHLFCMPPFIKHTNLLPRHS